MAPDGKESPVIPLLAGTALFLAGGLGALFVRRAAKGPVFAGCAVAAQALILPVIFDVLAGGLPRALTVSFSFPLGRAVLLLDPLAAFFAFRRSVVAGVLVGEAAVVLAAWMAGA